MSRSNYIDDKVDYPAQWVVSHSAHDRTLSEEEPDRNIQQFRLIPSTGAAVRDLQGHNAGPHLTAGIVSCVCGGYGCGVQVEEMERGPGDCCAAGRLESAVESRRKAAEVATIVAKLLGFVVGR